VEAIATTGAFDLPRDITAENAMSSASRYSRRAVVGPR
jgi:hypothetical protein